MLRGREAAPEPHRDWRDPPQWIIERDAEIEERRQAAAQPKPQNSGAAFDARAEAAARRVLKAWAQEDGREGIVTGRVLNDFVASLSTIFNERQDEIQAALDRRDARLADLEARLAALDGKKVKVPRAAAGIIRKVRNPDEL